MSRFQLHVQQWRGCTRCDLSATRTRVCHLRGKIPADVMLVGEAPGDVEDVDGNPFVGRAGDVLDQLVRRAFPDGTRVAVTNLVGCFPGRDDDGKFLDPPVESVRACSPRLKELVSIVDPRLIVCVGSEARDYLITWSKDRVILDRPIPKVWIDHPSRMLRVPEVQQNLMFKRAASTMESALEKVLRGEKVDVAD